MSEDHGTCDVLWEKHSKKKALRLLVQGVTEDDSPKETYEMNVVLSLRERM